MVDDEVKRMHYYNGLFLKEDDFNMDQNYYIRMRRLMNHSLNKVSGILEGLNVEPHEGKRYNVTAGVAFSYSGKEIVLISEELLDFSGRDPGVYYVTIAYNESLGDKDSSKGDQEIHIIEKPNICAIFERLPDNPEEIILAKVIVPEDTNWVSTKKYVQTDDRKEIGPALRDINKKVGIGTREPKHDLDVKASSIKLGLENSGGGQLVITNNPNDNSVYLEAFSSKGDGSASELILSGGWAENVPKLIVKANDTIFMDKVGIGTATPKYSLDVNASKIKLGLEKNGGGQLIITNNKDDNSIYLEAFNSQGCGGSASALILSGIDGKSVPWLDARADNTVISGNVGIGTTPSEKPLVVQSKGLNGELIGFVDDATKRMKWHINQNYDNKSGLNFGETGVADGRLFIQAGGNVGIGTTTPKKPLVVREKGANGELIGFEDSEGRTKWHINQNYGNKSGLNFVETGVADGRLFIQAGGNVGIGRINPSEKLEVNGTVKAGKFVGDGSGLTGIAGQWTEVPAGISYSAGKVGIGVYNPQYDLDVNASNIKLGLEKNGGGQLVITNHSKDDNSIYLEAHNSKGSHDSASELVLSGNAGGNVPVLRANADDTIFSGNVGIGITMTPDAQLHLFGGNGDLTHSEGDLKIGDERHRLKVGVVKSGEQAGDVRIRAEGGKNRLMLGVENEDTLTIVNGKVGIGTTNPQRQLHISKSNDNDVHCLMLQNSKRGGDTSVSLDFQTYGGSDAPTSSLRAIDEDWSSHLVFLTKEPGKDKNKLIERLRITNDGNVGIGTTDPSEKLEVNGTVKAIKFVGDGSELTDIKASQWTDVSGGISYSAGNVGIGTTSPLAKLEVNGNINGKADLFITGNIGIGTTNPVGTINIGDPMFRIDKSDGSPNMGYVRFGDGTGWKLHFGRSISGGSAITGTNGVLMTIHDQGNVGIGTMDPSAKLDVSGTIKAKASELGSLHVDGNIDTGTMDIGGPMFRVDKGDISPNVGFVRFGDGTGWKLHFGRSISGGNALTGTDGVLMTIHDQGNIGIGTMDPTDKLHIEGDGAFVKTRIFPSDDNTQGLTGFSLESREQEGKIHNWKIYTAPVGGGHGVPGNSLTFWEYGSKTDGLKPKMVLQANTGNVGIGTTDPNAKLHVQGSISINDYDLRLRGGKDGNHGIGWYGPGKPFADTNLDGPAVFGNMGGALGTNHEGAQKVVLYWNSDGNVGIGTTTPSAKLEVKGTFNATQKNFSINHPRKPETHNLVHSTLEGPEVAVFYRGEAKLSNDEATVTLPDYFETLTRKENRTVLLTPKFEDDKDEVFMLAASEVKDGKFSVRIIDKKDMSEKGRPKHQKFYWEVKAIRADVDTLNVEPEKTPVKGAISE
ncbi:hypothetical protein [Methanosarcina sp.]|uniref:hypothetical protein n=1 Tax=Methanosarcina sp. TaxID=2213 RepID=UPI003C719F3E